MPTVESDDAEHQREPKAPLAPLLDISSLIAVHSLFLRGQADPWGRRLAGSLANLLIYSDSARLVLPTDPEGSIDDSILGAGSISDFFADPGFVKPAAYSTIELRHLSREYIAEAFRNYARWARRNAPYLRQFCALHDQSWVRAGHLRRVHNASVYDLAPIRSSRTLHSLGRVTGLSTDHHLYCFDIVLRLPMYGQFVGDDSYYLHHPIRDALRTSANLERAGKPPPIALTFAPEFRRIVGRVSRDEYITTIKVLRDKVHEYGLRDAPQGDVHREIIRRIAAEARLPPRLRSEAAVVPITAAILSAVAGTELAGPAAAAAGAMISILPSAWALTSPYMPRGMANVKWLRWSLRWDLEEQARDVSVDESNTGQL